MGLGDWFVCVIGFECAKLLANEKRDAINPWHAVTS